MRGVPSVTPSSAVEEERRILGAADKSLSEIFAETGKLTVLYYLKTRYGLTLADLLDRPEDIRVALGDFLGAMGSEIVWQIMATRICAAVWPGGAEAGLRPEIPLLESLCREDGPGTSLSKTG